MIRSKIHKGLQRRGITRIDSSIRMEQTGSMELTVRAGEFVDVQGNVFVLPEDKSISFEPAAEKKYTSAWLTTADGKTLDVETRELTQSQLDSGESAPALAGKSVVRVLGWDWCIIPPNASSLPKTHTYTWIDNLPLKRKVDGSLRLVGRGEETGEKYEFDEIEHFAQRKGQGGIFSYCPKCGKVDDDRKNITEEESEKCGYCGNKDTVEVKNCDKEI